MKYLVGGWLEGELYFSLIVYPYFIGSIVRKMGCRVKYKVVLPDWIGKLEYLWGVDLVEREIREN